MLEEYFSMIESYVDEYAQDNGGATPSVREIASELGIGKTAVSKYLNYMSEHGMIQMNGTRNIITKKKSNITDTNMVPILGEVACGIPSYAEENIEEYVNLPTYIFGKGNFFLLRAKGDSMINADIDDGDLVLVRQQSTAEYNQIVVALIGDEATLKRFRPKGNCVVLHPENPNYENIIVKDCIIQGVAVDVIKHLL